MNNLKRGATILGLASVATLALSTAAQASVYGDDVTNGFYSSASCSSSLLVTLKCSVTLSVPTSPPSLKTVYVVYGEAQFKYCGQYGVSDGNVASPGNFSRLHYGAPVSVISVSKYADPALKPGRITCK